MLQLLATFGKPGFYQGAVANAIVDAVAAFGGVMTTDDLLNHVTTLDQPISVDYKGVRVWEIPPNGQGIVALMALNLLEKFDLKGDKFVKLWRRIDNYRSKSNGCHLDREICYRHCHKQPLTTTGFC